MDQNGKGHEDGKKFENIRITMYHQKPPILFEVSFGNNFPPSNSSYNYIYSCTFLLLGYEKIIALGFKNPRKNKFIFSESCHLLVTMI